MNKARFVCVFLGVISAAILWAVPSFTPVIDGVKDAGWGNVPDNSSTTQRIPTEFNLDGGLYVTDNNTSLIFGYDADNDPWVDGKSVHVHIVIDIASTAAGGGNACWGATNVTYGFPFLPEYDVVMQWNTDNQNTQFTGLNRWDGFWNQINELTNDAGGGGQWTELAIPKSLINVMDAGVVLNISMWLRPAWDSQGGVACLPADEDFPSDNAASPGTFDSQFSYTTQVAFGESDPPGIDHVKQIDRDEVEIVFDEPMNVTTLQNVANYTPTGWSIAAVSYATATTVGLRCNFDFTEGNNFSVVVGPGVTDVAGNPMDPLDNSGSWTAADYANVIFVVSAPAVYTCIRLKGSFNFYHEYDPSWGGGGQQMYDDGTHGDSTAGDHRHTIVFPLVPHIEGPYEWGAETCSAQWLIQGPNRQILVDNGGTIYTSYDVPDVTSAPCDVTFRCDMQFILDPFTGVAVAGSFNNWPYPGTTMDDADADGQWTCTVTIPPNSPRHHEFKFQYVDADPDQEWEGVANRTFDIVGAPATIDLGNMFFNDYLPAPQGVTAYRVGDNVDIRWTPGYQRVSFEVYAADAPDDPIGTGALLGTTSGDVFSDTDLSAVRKFYAVRTIAP